VLELVDLFKELAIKVGVSSLNLNHLALSFSRIAPCYKSFDLLHLRDKGINLVDSHIFEAEFGNFVFIDQFISLRFDSLDFIGKFLLLVGCDNNLTELDGPVVELRVLPGLCEGG